MADRNITSMWDGYAQPATATPPSSNISSHSDSSDSTASTAPHSSSAPSASFRHSLSVDDDLIRWTPLPQPGESTATTASDYDHQDAHRYVYGGGAARGTTTATTNVAPLGLGGGSSHHHHHHRPLMPPPAVGSHRHLLGTALGVPVDDARVGLLSATKPSSSAKGKRRVKATPAAAPVAADVAQLPVRLSGDENNGGSSATPTHSAGSSTTATTSRRRRQPMDDAESTLDSNLSALELRRKRNRESMQRTRVREREEVGKMREALVVMEKEYKQALLLQSQQQSDPVLTEYYSLSSESKQLKRENFLLRQNLERRRKAYERMERILADYHIEKIDTDLDDLDDEEAINSASAVFGITPISEDDAFALITRCSQAVQRLERTNLNVTMESESRCFGWNVRRKIIGDSGVHFLFTKTYLNLDPERAANRAWDIYKTSEKNNMKPIRVLRFETLQVVNENTYVMARDIVHPRHKGVIMRSVFLRFRMQTDTGFVVGRSCMNPKATPAGGAGSAASSASSEHSTSQHAGIRYADLTTWLEVNYLDPQRRDQVGCEVKFGGYCDYKTTHDLNARFMDVLFSVVQMENRVLEPLVPLLM